MTKETVTISIEFPKDEYEKALNTALDTWLNYSDLFSSHCIGYWGRGLRVEEGNQKIWIVIEDAIERDGALVQDIVRAFYDGKELPKGAHLLNKDNAEKVFQEIVKSKLPRHGNYLRDLDYDCEDEDIAIQKVFFGEIKYG